MLVVFFQPLVVCEFRGEVVVDPLCELLVILGQSDLDWGVDGLLLVVNRIRIRDLNVEQSPVESCGYWDSAPYLCNCFHSIDCNRWSFVVEDLYVGSSEIYVYVSGTERVERGLPHWPGARDVLSVGAIVGRSDSWCGESV